MKVEIIDPTRAANWDSFIIENFEPDIFHTAEWAGTIKASYNFKPLYFIGFNDGTPVALIPLMEVKSLLTGTRGISLPFTDFCKILMKSNIDLSPLIEYIISWGHHRNWRYFEFRSPNFSAPGGLKKIFYFTHEIELTSSVENLWKTLRDNNRRNIKKAMKKGLKVKFENSLESLREFYRLQILTRKRHGLPPQPFIFFHKLYNDIISKNMGFIASIYHQKKMIAGAIFLDFNHRSIFKFGASDESYHSLRPNNLLIWEALINCKERNNQVLNLGRTAPNNSGLLNFKRGWSGKEYELSYSWYQLRGKLPPWKGSSEPALPSTLAYLIPNFILRLAGKILYKHFD